MVHSLPNGDIKLGNGVLKGLIISVPWKQEWPKRSQVTSQPVCPEWVLQGVVFAMPTPAKPQGNQDKLVTYTKASEYKICKCSLEGAMESQRGLTEVVLLIHSSLFFNWPCIWNPLVFQPWDMTIVGQVKKKSYFTMVMVSAHSLPSTALGALPGIIYLIFPPVLRKRQH